MGLPTVQKRGGPWRARVGAAALACALVGVASGVHRRGGPVPSDYWQCDRQCRWTYAFFDYDVAGAAVSSWLPWKATTCHCTKPDAAAGSTTVLGDAPYESEGTPVTTSIATFDHAKPFDGAYWCGAFDSPYVCVVSKRDPTGPATTVTAVGDRDLPLHCGKCGACSSLADAEVMWRTRHDITGRMTACSTAFVTSQYEPWATSQTLGDLRGCLVDAGINLTKAPRAKVLGFTGLW